MPTHAEVDRWARHLEEVGRWCEEPWDEPPAPPPGQLPVELAHRAEEILTLLESRRAEVAEELRARRATAPARRSSVAGGTVTRFTVELDA